MHPAFFDACDELGVLVLEEIASWQWIGGSAFTRNAISMMEEMIARDRHHPSIILWGLLNEGRSSELFRTLNATAKKCDPWRCTIYADNDPEEGLELGTVYVPDVLGLNYKVPHLDELRPVLKGIKLSNTEHTNANTGERFKPDGTLFSEEESQIWQIERVLHDIAEFDRREWIAGNALWCMHDYGTEYAVSRPIQKSGVFDSWRGLKSAAYAIRAWWSKEPFVHIAGHWTYPEVKGTTRKIIVLSNCESVELLLNGKSLGSKQRDPQACWFEWDVAYKPGEIVALGRAGSGEFKDSRRTAGAAVALRLESLDTTLPANGTDITVLIATVVDKDGTPVPSANVDVAFSVKGGGTFFGLYGKPSVAAKYGVGRMAYRAGRAKGTATITASADGLTSATAAVNLV
jgi:beta-galactosidase